MPVVSLDLHVPEMAGAARLFVDLLGGRTVDRSATVIAGAIQRGGTKIGWREGPAASRITLQTMELRVPDADGAVAALPARDLLGQDGDGWRVRARALGVDVVVHNIDAPGDRPSLPATGPGMGSDALDPSNDAVGRGAAGTRVFDHVCFAVESLADAVDLLRTQLGGVVVFGGHNARLGTLSSQVQFGSGTKVELLQPTRPDTALRRFLDRHGPGMHHLTWHVHDVEVAALAAEAHGFAVVDTDLESRAHWWETYLRPSSAFGLLVQLSWTDRHHDDPLDDATVAAILAGKVDSRDYTMHWPTRS